MDFLNAKTITLLVGLLCILIGVLSYLFFKKYSELKTISNTKDDVIQKLFEQRELLQQKISEFVGSEPVNVAEELVVVKELVDEKVEPIVLSKHLETIVEEPEEVLSVVDETQHVTEKDLIFDVEEVVLSTKLDNEKISNDVKSELDMFVVPKKVRKHKKTPEIAVTV